MFLPARTETTLVRGTTWHNGGLLSMLLQAPNVSSQTVSRKEKLGVIFRPKRSPRPVAESYSTRLGVVLPCSPRSFEVSTLPN